MNTPLNQSDIMKMLNTTPVQPVAQKAMFIKIEQEHGTTLMITDSISVIYVAYEGKQVINDKGVSEVIRVGYKVAFVTTGGVFRDTQLFNMEEDTTITDIDRIRQYIIKNTITL